MDKYNCCALKLNSGGTLILRASDYENNEKFEDDIMLRLKGEVKQVKFTNTLIDLNRFIFNGNPYIEMRGDYDA